MGSSSCALLLCSSDLCCPLTGRVEALWVLGEFEFGRSPLQMTCVNWYGVRTPYSPQCLGLINRNFNPDLEFVISQARVDVIGIG